MTPQVATKAEFAALIGVSPGRISQYISAGKLGANELDGEGRAAKVRVPEALAALKLRLDPAQRLGNGIATRLEAVQPSPIPAATAPRPDDDELDRRLKQSKLDQEEAKARRAKEEERARAGIYVLAEDAKAEMAKLVGQLLQAIEGGLVDMASEIAAQHQLPQRDVIHLVRKHFREQRAKIASRIALDGASLAPELEDHEH